MKKHHQLQAAVTDYKKTVEELADNAKRMKEQNNPSRYCQPPNPDCLSICLSMFYVHVCNDANMNCCTSFCCVSDAVQVTQSRVNKLYAGLEHLAKERAANLDESYKLFQLNREVMK